MQRAPTQEKRKKRVKENLRVKCHSKVVSIQPIKFPSLNPIRVLDHKLDSYHQCKDQQYQSNIQKKIKISTEHIQLLTLTHSSGLVEELNQERFILPPRWSPKHLLLGRLLCLMKPEIALSNYPMEPMTRISKCFFL